MQISIHYRTPWYDRSLEISMQSSQPTSVDGVKIFVFLVVRPDFSKFNEKATKFTLYIYTIEIAKERWQTVHRLYWSHYPTTETTRKIHTNTHTHTIDVKKRLRTKWKWKGKSHISWPTLSVVSIFKTIMKVHLNFSCVRHFKTALLSFRVTNNQYCNLFSDIIRSSILASIVFASISNFRFRFDSVKMFSKISVEILAIFLLKFVVSVDFYKQSVRCIFVC